MSLLPIITTKKIHLSSKEKNIKVDFGLNIPGTAEYRRMLLSSQVPSMYYFYFLVLDDMTANLLTGLKDPNLRHHLISSMYRGQNADLLSKGGLKMVSYEQVLQTHATADYNLTDLSNDYNNEFRSSVVIDYKPKSARLVIDTYTDPEPTTSPMPYIDYYWRGQGFADNIGRITDTGWRPGQPRNRGTAQSTSTDMGVQAERETIEFGNIPVPYEYLATDSLDLLCFVDMDLTGDRPPFTGNNTVHYDLLLTRDNTTGRLNVPTQINSFYIDDPIPSEGGAVESGMSELRPYHGPVHYHAANPQDPEAYVGWMAGHPNGRMGPKLKQVTTPNYKITSDLKVYEDQPMFLNTLDTISPSWMSDNLLPPSQLRGNLRINNLTKTVQELVEDVHEHRSDYCRRNPNIVDYESQQTAYVSYVSDPDGTSPLEESHHGFAISINFMDLVKYRSRLGYILEYHQRTGNTTFVEKCMVHSKIRDIVFYRHRVVNNPYERNERQSLVYSKYDDNQYGTFIVSSSDRDANSFQGNPAFKNRLLPSESPRGNLEEVEILQLDRANAARGAAIMTESPKYSRQFIVKDRDLFHNINYGKYSYMVKINLRDGIQKVLKDEYDTATGFIKNYKDFLFYAQIPYRISSEGATGNYNYATKSFTPEFKNDAMNQRSITGAIGSYIQMKSILSAKNQEDLQEEMLYLSGKLHLESENLQDMLEFYNILEEMRASIKSLLSTGIELSSGRKEENYISSVENATGGNMASIEVVSKTNVISKAIPKDTVIADYSPTPGAQRLFTGLDTYRERLVDILDGSYIFPSQFLTLQTAEFDPEDEPSNTASVDLITVRGLNRKKKTKKKKKKADSRLPLITYVDYKAQNSIARTNTNIKLEYLIRSQGDDTNPQIGETDKPDSFYPLATQRFFGGITLGPSGGTVNNFSGGIRYLQDVLDFMSPGLSDAVKKSICESAYREDSRDFFLEEVERRYQDLVESRELMGVFYDYVHNSLLTKDLVGLSRMYNISYEDKYKGNYNPKVEATLRKNNIFSQHKRKMVVVSPIMGIAPITLGGIKIKKESLNLGTKTVICVKMDSFNSTDAPAVNNVAFLEV